MKPKISANERRLAKLLDEFNDNRAWGVDSAPLAAFLAKRGVLLVSKETVPDHECGELVSYYPRLCAPLVRSTLRRLARGAR